MTSKEFTDRLLNRFAPDARILFARPDVETPDGRVIQSSNFSVQEPEDGTIPVYDGPEENTVVVYGPSARLSRRTIRRFIEDIYVPATWNPSAQQPVDDESIR